MLSTVEKVIFLQDIDMFEHTSTRDLAHIAAITQETVVKSGQAVFKENDIPDAMYMIIDGKVRLTRDDREVMVAGHKEVFGTWALFDDEPRVATATALETCRLLRIEREDFIDLLADHVQITRSILKTLARRLRNLMIRADR